MKEAQFEFGTYIVAINMIDFLLAHKRNLYMWLLNPWMFVMINHPFANMFLDIS